MTIKSIRRPPLSLLQPSSANRPRRSGKSQFIIVENSDCADPGCTDRGCQGAKSEPEQIPKFPADSTVNHQLQSIVNQLRDDQYRSGEAATTMLTNIRESHNKRINKLTEGAEKERLRFRVETIRGWVEQLEKDENLQIATIGFDKNCTAKEGLQPRQTISQLDTVVVKSGGQIRVMPFSNSCLSGSEKSGSAWRCGWHRFCRSNHCVCCCCVSSDGASFSGCIVCTRTMQYEHAIGNKS